MKKALITISIAIVVIGIVFYGINQKERQIVQQNLITAIEKSRVGNELVTIDFKKITGFSWDKVYVFTPYTPEEEINQQLGFNWSKANLIEYYDSFNLLVFVKENKVVQYVKFPRTNGKFIVESKNEFAPDEKVEFNQLY
ncbi:hypothetical protein [Paenibacillus taichungensis]